MCDKGGVMDFEKVKQSIKEIRLDTLRVDDPAHFEAVITKQETGKLTARLEGFLGKPVFPSGNPLASQILKAIEGYGGIMAGQTLFYWNQGDETVFAMLWPWADGQHTTLKIIKK
jgi:hypothetical protein